MHPQPLCLRGSFVKFPFHRVRAKRSERQKFLRQAIRPNGKKKTRNRRSVAVDTFPFNWRGVASSEVEGDFNYYFPFSIFRSP